MTREELRGTVQMALDAINAAETEATTKVIARDKIAATVTLNLADAWSELAALVRPGAYQTLEMRLAHHAGEGKLRVEWEYYDEIEKHIEAKDLRALVDKVKSIKKANAAKPQTLEDVQAALPEPYTGPPLPALAATLAGEF